MVVVSYSGKEINAKLVYYGPGLSGKTTNLEFIYDSVPSTHRGKMVSMKTRTERTLFFDFLPVDLGEMGGFKTRFLLYTVPGQVYYNATRKLVLRGVDAVVFVADSGRGKMNENLESLENLRENLREYGMDLNAMPWVIQYNKRDIPDAHTLEELNLALNPTNVPTFEAVATDGTGVFETFKGISKLLLDKLSKEIKTSPRSQATEASRARLAASATAAKSAEKAPAPAAASASTGTAPTTVTPSASPQGSSKAPVARTSSHSPGAPAKPTTTAAASSNGQTGPRSVDPPMNREAEGDSDGKVTLGQRIARFFKKGPADVSVRPSGTSSAAAEAPAPVPMAAVAPPAPAPAPPPVAPPVTAAMPSPPMAAPALPRVAVSIGSGHLARIDLNEGAVESNGSIEKRIRVPVPVHLTAEEARTGVTLKLIVDIELTSEGENARTGTD